MGILNRLWRGDNKDSESKAEVRGPDSDEKNLIDQFNTDYEDAMSSRPDSNWQKIHDYVEGDQWGAPENEEDDWMPKPVTNVCWMVLQNTHANATAGQVSVTITERTPGKAEIAQKLQDIVMSYWDALDMNSKLADECEWIRPEVGTVFFKAPWNPDRNNGEGDLDCYVVHPKNVLIDPNITSPRDVQQADFIIFSSPKSRSYLMRRYSKETDALCRFTKKQLKALLTAEPTSDVEYLAENNNVTGREQLLLHEYWHKDENGKLQVAWVANGRILKYSADDEEMAKEGFYKHGKYPVVVAHHIVKPKSVYGRSEIEPLLTRGSGQDGIQDCINKLDQKVLVGAAYAALGAWVVRWGKVKRQDNGEYGLHRPGVVIPVKESVREDVARLSSGEIPQFLMLWRDKKFQDAERVTQHFNVARGEALSGRRTAAETLALREQALKPQNDRVETLNRALSELVELWIEMLAEFGTSREYELMTPQGPKLIPFDPKKELFDVAEPKEEAEDDDQDDTSTRRIHFRAKVDVGANLVLTKAFMYELAFQLWDRKALDIDGLYAMMPDWPGKSESLNRMKQMMEQAQMEQVQQALGAGQASPEAGSDMTEQEAQIAAWLEHLPPEAIGQLQGIQDPEQRMAALAEMFMQQQGGSPQA